VRHFTNPDFWEAYRRLPEAVQRLADRNYELLKRNPRHPSLHFKRVGRFWSARVGIHHRVLGVDAKGDVVWFWIGSHADTIG
jgi:hypothetical protein